MTIVRMTIRIVTTIIRVIKMAKCSLKVESLRRYKIAAVNECNELTLDILTLNIYWFCRPANISDIWNQWSNPNNRFQRAMNWRMKWNDWLQKMNFCELKITNWNENITSKDSMMKTRISCWKDQSLRMITTMILSLTCLNFATLWATTSRLKSTWNY